MIRNICYPNAGRYLALGEPGAALSTHTEAGRITPV